MSAATKQTHAHIVGFKILRGTLKRMALHQAQLLLNEGESLQLKMSVTLRGKTSKKKFRRTLVVTFVALQKYGMHGDDIFAIKGTLRGKPFEGAYRGISRKGFIHLAV